MARKDRINQKSFHNPPLRRGARRGLLFFDVNITIKKVNEKNPLEALIKRPVPHSEDRPSAP
jgi:hypothetical protein